MLLFEIINKLRRSLSEDYYNKHWGRFTAKVITFFLLSFCVIFLVIWLIRLALNNLEVILVGTGIFCCIIGFVLSVLPKKPPEPPASTYLHYDPIVLENTHAMIKSGLCIIIGELAEIINLRKPASLTQLDAPIHYDIIGNVPIYHYLVPKQNHEIIDTYDMLGILQNTIEQKLNANAFPGINQAVFFHNGQAYPSIMIDALFDKGNMIQIDIAITSGQYVVYRTQRLYNSINESGEQRPKDKDF